MTAKRIEQLTIGIPVDNLQEAARWYETYMGCEVVPPMLGYVDLKLTENQKLLLFKPNTTDSKEIFYAGANYKENPHYLLRVTVLDIEDFHESLKDSGGQVEEIVGDPGAALGRAFIFSDPYGNRFLAWSGFHCDSKNDLLKDLNR